MLLNLSIYSTMNKIIYTFFFISSLLLVGCSKSSNNYPKDEANMSKTTNAKILKTESGFQLVVNDKPFQIKGAGLEFCSQEKLAAHGGNMFRTWRTENGKESGQEVLDRAQKNGLYVLMGIEVARERHGFDYNDSLAVRKQLEEIKKEVLKYKNHPALLIWGIGNELNLRATNPLVWNAVNEISTCIHTL